MTVTKAWDGDSDSMLRTLAAEGLSATQIAGKLGRTRNAVCGRAWRLGIGLHGTAEAKPRRLKDGYKQRVPKRKLMARVPHTVQPALVDPPTNLEAVECSPVPFLEVGEGCCKWPVGNLFCNSTALPRRPYCAQHTYYSRQLPTAAQQPAQRKRAFYR